WAPAGGADVSGATRMTRSVRAVTVPRYPCIASSCSRWTRTPYYAPSADMQSRSWTPIRGKPSCQCGSKPLKGWIGASMNTDPAAKALEDGSRVWSFRLEEDRIQSFTRPIWLGCRWPPERLGLQPSAHSHRLSPSETQLDVAR